MISYRPISITVKGEVEKPQIHLMEGSRSINIVSNNSIELHIIPETLRVTTIGQKDVGEFVNLEIDSQTQSIVQTIMRRK